MLVPSKDRVRSTYLGGRDITAIVGVDPYSSPLDVYAKVCAGAEIPMNGFMLRGLLFEPGMIEYVAKERGVRLTRDAFYLDDRVPFFGASSDAVEGNAKRPQIMHEFKTTTTRNAHKWGSAGSDDVEETAFFQCQWNMGINGAREAHVWCLIVDSGEMPRHYVVPRNNKVIGELRAQGEAFWLEHVLPQIPPAATRAANEAVHALYPVGDPSKLVEPTTEMIATAEAFAKARAEEKDAKARKDAAGVMLKSMLGEAERSSWTGGSTTWKARSLKPSVNWEQVAYEIAQRTKLHGDTFNGIVKEQTSTPKTATRVLTVSIRGMSED